MILAFLVLCITTLAMGVGVFFFGRSANREACGSVPHVEPDENCPNQQAGLCPIEDPSGVMKLANQAKVSYHKQPIHK